MARPELFRQAGAYTVVSAVAFAVDLLLLAVLVSLLGVPYLAAATISFGAGTLLVYWASIRHIFEFRRVENVRHEFAAFVSIGVLGLIINLSVIYFSVDILQLHYLVGKCGAAGFTFMMNFMVRRWMLFTAWPHSDHSASSDAGRIP